MNTHFSVSIVHMTVMILVKNACVAWSYLAKRVFINIIEINLIPVFILRLRNLTA